MYKDKFIITIHYKGTGEIDWRMFDTYEDAKKYSDMVWKEKRVRLHGYELCDVDYITLRHPELHNNKEN